MGKWHQPLRERIEGGSIPVTESGCWIWLKCKRADGYGSIGINKTTVLAHRASWTAFRGEIPDGLYVLHHCDNRICVNPEHLFIGTHTDNMIDRDTKGRNKPRPGILNPKTKLTPQQVLAIRNSSVGCDKLARQYGMNKSTMARIRSRQYWKCIP
jgi:hypothetical protein